MTISARSRAVLRSVNWFWPAYMSRGYVMDIIAKLEAEPIGPPRAAVFESELPAMYSPAHLAAMVLERYARVPMVCLFRKQIAEAVEASQLGLHCAAVALLIPTIEGIVREHATTASRDLRNASRSALTIEMRSMIDHEQRAHPGCSASATRVSMIEMFEEFLTQSLYIDTRVSTAPRELNRHGTLHGIYRAYGSATNFYILMSMIDLLTFVLTFRTSGISPLAPDMTKDARRLARYYLGLRDVGRGAAASAGSRL